jgi:hypothetical protein
MISPHRLDAAVLLYSAERPESPLFSVLAVLVEICGAHGLFHCQEAPCDGGILLES